MIFKHFLCIDKKHIRTEDALKYFLRIIETGNGFMHSGNKPLPEPMLTQI